jgi:predicted RNA-binding Zn-ribbon protein involved in translation (DUF1610 family)
MASRAIPLIIQIVMFYLVISWLVRLARRHRNAQTPPTGTGPRKARPTATPTSARTRTRPPARPGSIERSQVEFNGVLWDVTRRPRHDISAGARSPIYETYVEQPPRCPKCGLGVIEEKSWLGYTWSCPECGLKKHSGRSMQDVAEALARMMH